MAQSLRRLLTFIVLLLPYIFIFLGSIAHPVDFDQGWHLKFGQEFVEQGKFSYTNTWSSEMEGYKWFNSSWLLDIYRYVLYQAGGFLFLMLNGSVIVTLLFFIVSRTYKLSLFHKSLIFPLLLFVEDPINSHSLRGQQVSLLFITVVYMVIWRFQKKPGKILYILIPFFLLWTNLHAQFLLGLGILGLWAILYTLLHFNMGIKNITKYIAIPITLSCLITLINPYGYHIYLESIAHFGNPALKYITEFAQLNIQSDTFINYLFWGFGIIVSVGVVIKTKRLREFIPFFVITTLLYGLAFLSGRFIWSMYVSSIPMLVLLVSLFKIKNKEMENTVGLSIFLGLILYLIFAVLPERKLGNLTWDSYCEFASCSQKGAQILTNEYPGKRIFTDYNLGGWLIWNYPKIKPSMDGRMPIWEDYAGRNAFEEYYKIESGHVDPDTTPYTIFFINNNRNLSVVLNDKVVYKKTWRIVFRDDKNTIYEKMKKE